MGLRVGEAEGAVGEAVGLRVGVSVGLAVGLPPPPGPGGGGGGCTCDTPNVNINIMSNVKRRRPAKVRTPLIDLLLKLFLITGLHVVPPA